jgi:hypothetical protein
VFLAIIYEQWYWLVLVLVLVALVRRYYCTNSNAVVGLLACWQLLPNHGTPLYLFYDAHGKYHQALILRIP